MQRTFNLTCPKCGKEFDSPSYTTFQVEVPVEIPEIRAIVNQTIFIKASPCPDCMCGVPITNDTEWRWHKHETTTSSIARERSTVESPDEQTLERDDSYLDDRPTEDASSERSGNQ